MIIDKIEQLTGRFEKTLQKAKRLQKKGMVLAMQKEQDLRSSAHSLFDQGLSLVGKGVALGRKAGEAFVAETHRKAEKLQRVQGNPDLATDAETAEPEASTMAEHLAENHPHHPEGDTFKHRAEFAQAKNRNRKSAAKKNNMADKRVRAHSNASRSH